jgi:hypothetical protein
LVYQRLFNKGIERKLLLVRTIDTNKQIVIDFLEKLKQESNFSALNLLADFLGYKLIKNPVDPSSEWLLLSHPELDVDTQALMSLTYDENLTVDTTVRQLRKRFELVEVQKEKFRGYAVYLYAFVGNGRILIFKGFDSNRDERIDISKSSITKVTLFADNFLQLSANKISIEDDDFGFGKEVVGLDKLFKRELSNLFTLTVQLYRKQIAEMITTNKVLENKIIKLLPDYEQNVLVKQDLKDKLLNPSFKEAIGSVIDTIVLRVVLRRFLESYHGLEPFTKQDDLKELGLGQREGKMQDVIQYLAEIQFKHISESDLKAAIKSNNSGQISWDLFENATHEIKLKNTSITFYEIYDRLRNQFELAYGGDLFSSDVANVVNEVEKEINNLNPNLLLHLMVDISEERFNFRYEDLPPEMIQDFYETSMGYSLRYSVNREGEPVVNYSDDLQEKKHRGAYYTNQKLVDYIIDKTVGSKLDEYQKQLNSSVKCGQKRAILHSLKNISSLTVIDITCGGGSFLRGAFRYLSSKREGIVRALEKIDSSELYEQIIEKYPFFNNDVDAEAQWEKHVLLRMIYGIDIDYKALIISSQTLTLSSLSNWQVGVNFPRLIGLTLIQQNALVSPLRITERKEVFSPYKNEIKKMIRLRKKIMTETDANKTKELSLTLDNLRLNLQEKLYSRISNVIEDDYREAIMPQSIEANFPEVFFEENGELKEDSGFSVCVGNPPWEVWKPNAEEFFEVYDEEYRNAGKQEKIKKVEDILDNNKLLKRRWKWLQSYYAKGSEYFLQHDYYDYQRIKVDGKFTGGDINLYKISTERAYQILQKDGRCGYLVPSNVYTDRGSTGLRMMLFNHSKLGEISSFENRMGIFPNVHRSYKFAIILFNKGGVSDIFRAFFYKLSLDELYNSENFLDIPVSLVKKLSPETLSVMEFRKQEEVELMNKLTKYPLLSEKIEGKWNLHFYSEFHMTNNSNLFNEERVGLPLYEGKNIWQFEKDLERSRYYIEKEKGNSILVNKEVKRIEKFLINETGLTKKDALYKYFQTEAVPLDFVRIHNQYYRLAFREVASSTNKRSLISTVIPQDVFLGNTLITVSPVKLEMKVGNIYYKHQYSLKELLVIVGMFNSFVMDFIVRRKITTHLNIFYMYQLPMPRLSYGDKYFEDIARRTALLICTSDEYSDIKEEAGLEEGVNEPLLRQKIQNQIDAYVAKIYELSREEFLYILSTFKSAKHGEEMQEIAQGVIEQFDILSEKGELECPV